MTQHDLDRAVARATGESLATISQRGFVTLHRIAVEREPLTVDWDVLTDRQLGIFPQRSRQRQATS